MFHVSSFFAIIGEWVSDIPASSAGKRHPTSNIQHPTSNMWQELVFKFVFFTAVVVFCLTVIGFFLLAIKIILLFVPEIKFVGLLITHL